MPPRRSRSSLGSFLGLLLAALPPAAAQEPPARPVEVLPSQQVEVVRLEVVVAEKRGRPKAGLTREDFEVLEDGKPQPIVQFHAFARPDSGAPGKPGEKKAAEPAAPAPEAEEAEDLLPARYVVLAIDDVHMDFESLVRAGKAVGRFIDDDLRPEDQVALVTTSGASALSQEFTADRAVLRQTLSRLSGKGRPVEWTGLPHITEYQAELIEVGDPLALDAAVQELMQAGIFLDQESAAQEARVKARGILTEASYNARLTLEALDSLCRGLAGITGRKALFLFSDGFVTGLSSRTSAGFDLRRIADAGTRAGVVIYALDTRGLVAGPPSASASSPLKVGPTTAGMIDAMRRRSDEATRGAMHALAADTGGFLVEGRNDLRGGLREVLRDTETYYVLAYEPTNASRDGGFRRIEVRLPGRRDAKVRTRSGYFAPAPGRPGPAAGDARAVARRAEQRRAEMTTALTSLAPLSAIPVRLSAGFVSLDPGVARVVVSGSVGVSTLPFVRRADRLQATVEAVAVVYDEDGAVAATLETERSAMDLAPPDYERLLAEGLPYQKAVPLRPGRYQVRLAAREDATGMLGSAWQRLEVPDLAAGRLALSSLFLMKEGEGSEAAAAPGEAPALRSVQAQPRFRRSESLYLQLYAYNPKRGASGKVDLAAQAEVLRGGHRLGAAAPEPMAEGEPGGAVPHVSRIRLQRFEPGEYELRVTVTDRLAGALATRSVGFTVVE